MSLEVAQVDRPRERFDLRAAVVDVVLARDVVAREGEQRGQRIAEDRATDMPDMQRARRVGGDVLDIDLDARAEAGMSERLAGVERLRHDVGPDRRGEAEVQETGSGHARGLDPRVGGDAFGQLLRDLARRTVGAAGKDHRGIGRHVAVARVARRLDRHWAVVQAGGQIAVGHHGVERLEHGFADVGENVHGSGARLV